MKEESYDLNGIQTETFVVQVQFRQNHSWQGTITWTNEKKTQRFRSTLELLKLMDDALNATTSGPEEEQKSNW